MANSYAACAISTPPSKAASKRNTASTARYARTTDETGYNLVTYDGTCSVMNEDPWQQLQWLVERVQNARHVHSDCLGGSCLECAEIENLTNHLIDRLRPQVERVVRKTLFPCEGPGKTELIQDAIQQASWAICRGLSSYDPQKADFKFWAYKVIVHEIWRVVENWQEQCRQEIIIDMLRDQDEEDGRRQLEPPAQDIDIVELIALRDFCRRVIHLVESKLKAHELLVWIAYLWDKPHREIARLCRMKENSVGVTIQRIRAKVAVTVISDPDLLSDELIREVVRQCQQSSDPLGPEEEKVLQGVLGSKSRRPPWGKTKTFQRACLKIYESLSVEDAIREVDIKL